MTKSKEITPHIISKALLLVGALGVLCLALFGCNPVKRVISNPKHYQAITEHVISSGACVNDTIIQSKSDTLITFDTLFAVDFETDTFTVDREIVRTVTKVVTKTVKIRDTVRQVVTDNSRIELLQKAITKKDLEKAILAENLQKSEDQYKKMQKARNKWRLYFWLLVAAIGVFLFRKPLKFLINRVSPIKLK